MCIIKKKGKRCQYGIHIHHVTQFVFDFKQRYQYEIYIHHVTLCVYLI